MNFQLVPNNFARIYAQLSDVAHGFLDLVAVTLCYGVHETRSTQSAYVVYCIVYYQEPYDCIVHKFNVHTRNIIHTYIRIHKCTKESASRMYPYMY